MICSPNTYCMGDHIKRNEMEGARMGDSTGAYSVLVRNLGGNRSLG
jgi:hypothetical protein